MRSVGGTETFTGLESASNPEKSLYMLSFPEMYGVPNAIAPSRHPSAACLSCRSRSGSSEEHQQKLSRSAMVASGMPIATNPRIARSIAASAMR